MSRADEAFLMFLTSTIMKAVWRIRRCIFGPSSLKSCRRPEDSLTLCPDTTSDFLSLALSWECMLQSRTPACWAFNWFSGLSCYLPWGFLGAGRGLQSDIWLRSDSPAWKKSVFLRGKLLVSKTVWGLNRLSANLTDHFYPPSSTIMFAYIGRIQRPLFS